MRTNQSFVSSGRTGYSDFQDNVIAFTKVLALLLVIALASIWMNSCKTTKTLTVIDLDHDTRVRFEECIDAHPSDAVCDSCWNAIVVPIYGGQ